MPKCYKIILSKLIVPTEYMFGRFLSKLEIAIRIGLL